MTGLSFFHRLCLRFRGRGSSELCARDTGAALPSHARRVSEGGDKCAMLGVSLETALALSRVRPILDSVMSLPGPITWPAVEGRTTSVPIVEAAPIRH